VGMLILGVGFVWWYPNQGRSVPEGADRLRITADVAVVPQHPQAQDPSHGNVTSHLLGPVCSVKFPGVTGW
jgi:hypothetical protein